MSVFFNLFDWLQGTDMEEEKPKWLAPLQGELPLLNISQCNLVAAVHYCIMHKAREEDQVSQAREREIREIKRIAQSMKKHFDMVVKKLQRNASSRQCFQEKYPKWRRFRDMNVSHLNKIADSIDTDRQNCQISKAIGSIVSLIGGGICLATEGKKDNETSQMVGSAMMGLGTLTSAGTSAVEKMLLRENVDKAKKIMQLDSECIEYLIDWLDEASSLQKAMDSITYMNYNQDYRKAVESFKNIHRQDLSKRQKQKAILNTVKSLNLPAGLKEEVSDIIGMLVTVSMLFDSYRPIFNLATKGYNVLSQLRLSADLFRAAYIGMNTIGTVATCGRMTSVQKQRVFGGMALDAFNILLVYSQDPSSIEGKEIRKVADELEKEANKLESLYQTIKQVRISED